MCVCVCVFVYIRMHVYVCVYTPEITAENIVQPMKQFSTSSNIRLRNLAVIFLEVFISLSRSFPPSLSLSPSLGFTLAILFQDYCGLSILDCPKPRTS